MYSIIDFGTKDFIRDDNGKPFYFANLIVAEKWLIENGKKYGWTNTRTFWYEWLDERGAAYEDTNYDVRVPI